MIRWYTVAAAVVAYISANSAVAASSYGLVSRRGEPAKPQCRVSVVVPAWREPEELLERSLSSLKDQTVVEEYPDMFDFVFVGCEGVDLSIPLEYGYRVMCAERGKLLARHIGILNSEGDIIVAADADTYYPPSWLDAMLRPFHSRDVVATTSTTWQGWLEAVAGIPKLIVFSMKMSGRGSAFRKWAYFAVGGFDLEADRRYLETRDMRILLAEEEFGFKSKLEKLGRVVLVNAPVIHLGGTAKRGLRS